MRRLGRGSLRSVSPSNKNVHVKPFTHTIFLNEEPSKGNYFDAKPTEAVRM